MTTNAAKVDQLPMPGSGRRRRRLLKVVLCVVCVQLALLSLCWLLPGAQLVHDAHFELGAAVRSSQSWNKRIMGSVRAFLSALDALGADRSAAQLLDPAEFGAAANASDVGALAHACVSGLHRLYPSAAHSAYYHGIMDAWAFWVLILMQVLTRVRQCYVAAAMLL